VNHILAELELRRRDFHRFVVETFPDFVDGWFYHDLCARLAQFMLDVRQKKRPRLILCMPPRLGKSELCSVRFPLFCLLNNPTWEVIVSSYSQDICERFSRRARSLVQHDYVNSLWRVDDKPSHSTQQEWSISRNTNGGTYKAASRGSAMTGSGANVLIIDDPLKNMVEADSNAVKEGLWEWFASTARTRLAPGGGILLIQTRWSPDDLAGRLIAESGKNPRADKYEQFVYRALAEVDEKHRCAGEALHEERFTLEEMQSTKESLPIRIWNALYQQNPTVPGGVVVLEEWLRFYTEIPPVKDFDQIIQAWDLRFGAKKDAGSYVVGQVWGRIGARYYLLDQFRDRISYVASKDAVESLTARWPIAALKLVENKANGPALQDDLQDTIPGIVLTNPRGDKVQRLERCQPAFRAGNVFVPESAPWKLEYVTELTTFPNAPNDDQVDVTSLALGWFLDGEADLGTVSWI
jgi:predicted phage terminase large subunit-like protein